MSTRQLLFLQRVGRFWCRRFLLKKSEKRRAEQRTGPQGREPNDKEVLLVLLHFHAALKITMIKDLQLLVHQR